MLNAITRLAFKLIVVPIIIISLLYLAAVNMAWGITNSAKDRVHIEAPDVRALYRQDICEGTEMYYSAKNGTLLILCGIPNSKTWGGIIWRVTENNGMFILGEEMYEVTVFAAERRYWNNAIKRDGYAPVYVEPSMHRIMRESY